MGRGVIHLYSGRGARRPFSFESPRAVHGRRFGSSNATQTKHTCMCAPGQSALAFTILAFDWYMCMLHVRRLSNRNTDYRRRKRQVVGSYTLLLFRSVSLHT